MGLATWITLVELTIQILVGMIQQDLISIDKVIGRSL